MVSSTPHRFLPIIQIRRMEKTKTQLIEGALHQASTISSELVFGGNQPSAQDKMKHNGTYVRFA
jgi:hypothetical protein